jgi:hypothetical protein
MKEEDLIDGHWWLAVVGWEEREKRELGIGRCFNMIISRERYWYFGELLSLWWLNRIKKVTKKGGNEKQLLPITGDYVLGDKRWRNRRIHSEVLSSRWKIIIQKGGKRKSGPKVSGYMKPYLLSSSGRRRLIIINELFERPLGQPLIPGPILISIIHNI